MHLRTIRVQIESKIVEIILETFQLPISSLTHACPKPVVEKQETPSEIALYPCTIVSAKPYLIERRKLQPISNFQMGEIANRTNWIGSMIEISLEVNAGIPTFAGCIFKVQVSATKTACRARPGDAPLSKPLTSKCATAIRRLATVHTCWGPRTICSGAAPNDEITRRAPRASTILLVAYIVRAER